MQFSINAAHLGASNVLRSTKSTAIPLKKIKLIYSLLDYFNVFGLRLPSTEAIDDLFKILCNDALEILKGHLMSVLIEKKVFHRFRFLGLWTVAVDATGVYNWGENPIDSALHKTSKGGKTTWFSSVIYLKPN